MTPKQPFQPIATLLGLRDTYIGLRQLAVPLLVREGGVVTVVFLYRPAIVVPGYQDPEKPPSVACVVDPRSGALVAQRNVSPGEFGQPHAPDQALGHVSFGSASEMEAWSDRRRSLLSALDVLLPAFAGDVAATAPGVHDAAVSFQEVFPTVAEAPLVPYYHALGKELFDWIERLAPPGSPRR